MPRLHLVNLSGLNSATTILFDLDGTLIDHFNVIYRCYQHALRKLGKPEPSYDFVKRSVGGAMEYTIQKFVTEEEHADAIRLFREHFAEIYLEDITVLPGVEWLLGELKSEGRKLAVFTNKQGPGSRAIIKHLGFDVYFDRVFGSLDTPFRKPDQAFSQHVLRELGAVHETTWMIGDSPWDIQAAQAVGMKCFCVCTGTHEYRELEAAGADGVFGNFFEMGEQLFACPRR
jgi:phosphoglycolate phosphatase